jgi:predicted secreted protein
VSRSAPHRPTSVRANVPTEPVPEVESEKEPTAPLRPEWGRRIALFLWVSSFSVLIFYELLLDLLKLLKHLLGK